MIVQNYCHTRSTMFRNFIIKKGNLKLNKDLGGDFQLWMRALGKQGKGMKS